jgi:hypothetical protein
MKPFQLLPQLALVIAVVYACSDSMAPANAHSSLSVPGTPALRGESPPPPVETEIAVCTTTAGCANFSGTYFSNGTTTASALAAAEVGDPSLTFSGVAWLKFDNKQPIPGVFVSANARFKVVDDKDPTGAGTLTIGPLVLTITDVLTFTPLTNCGILGEPCADITFKYRDQFNGEGEGHATADNCTFVPPVGSSSGFFDCGVGD